MSTKHKNNNKKTKETQHNSQSLFELKQILTAHARNSRNDVLAARLAASNKSAYKNLRLHLIDAARNTIKNAVNNSLSKNELIDIDRIIRRTILIVRNAFFTKSSTSILRPTQPSPYAITALLWAVCSLETIPEITERLQEIIDSRSTTLIHSRVKGVNNRLSAIKNLIKNSSDKEVSAFRDEGLVMANLRLAAKYILEVIQGDHEITGAAGNNQTRLLMILEIFEEKLDEFYENPNKIVMSKAVNKVLNSADKPLKERTKMTPLDANTILSPSSLKQNALKTANELRLKAKNEVKVIKSVADLLKIPLDMQNREYVILVATIFSNYIYHPDMAFSQSICEELFSRKNLQKTTMCQKAIAHVKQIVEDEFLIDELTVKDLIRLLQLENNQSINDMNKLDQYCRQFARNRLHNMNDASQQRLCRLFMVVKFRKQLLEDASLDILKYFESTSVLTYQPAFIDKIAERVKKEVLAKNVKMQYTNVNKQAKSAMNKVTSQIRKKIKQVD